MKYDYPEKHYRLLDPKFLEQILAFYRSNVNSLEEWEMENYYARFLCSYIFKRKPDTNKGIVIKTVIDNGDKPYPLGTELEFEDISVVVNPIPTWNLPALLKSNSSNVTDINKAESTVGDIVEKEKIHSNSENISLDGYILMTVMFSDLFRANAVKTKNMFVEMYLNIQMTKAVYAHSKIPSSQKKLYDDAAFLMLKILSNARKKGKGISFQDVATIAANKHGVDYDILRSLLGTYGNLKKTIKKIQ